MEFAQLNIIEDSIGVKHRECIVDNSSIILRKPRNPNNKKSREISLSCIRKIESASPTSIVLRLHSGDSLTFEGSCDEIAGFANKLNHLFPRTTMVTAADFSIVSEIGRGRYSVIELARENRTQKEYAIKVVDKSFLIENGKPEAALIERNILERINRKKHPFIVNLDYAFQDEDSFFLCMEYVKGGDLFRHMKIHRRLSIDEIRLFVAEIAIAIHFLHGFGIVYRDLKPENVMLDEEGHIKLIDFNLSKQLRADQESTGTFCGTVEYLAPEIVNKQPYGKPVDWWSLGIMIFEMVCNRTPFGCQNQSRTLQKISDCRFGIPDSCDYNLCNLIDGLLRKDPAKRFCYKDIVNHPFFHPLDFTDVYKKKYTPLRKPKLISLDSQNVEPKPLSSIYDEKRINGTDILNIPDFYLDNSSNF